MINLKVQYGIDTDGDGVLDAWLPAADAGSAGNWSPAAVLAAPATTLARVKALRVGIIVRGEQFDRAATGPFEWVLLTAPRPASVRAPADLRAQLAPRRAADALSRVRTGIPLRNQIWHAHG